MVTAHYFGKNTAILYLVHDSLGYNEIVDSPPDVLFTSVIHIAPPGILHLFGIERAEGVAKTALEQFGKFAPFLVRKACAEMVCFRVFEVDFLVGNVKVAAVDYRFFLVKRLDIIPQ